MARPVPGSTLGIDVSHWQGDIDWQQVANVPTEHGPVTFVYAKASTGKGGTDPAFSRNALGATSAGLPFGAYHWIKPNLYDPVQEADHFCDVISQAQAAGARIELAPMIDLEQPPPSNTSASAVVAYLDAVCGRVRERTGIVPIVYVGSNYAKQYLGTAKLRWPVWVPQYNRPSCNYAPEVENPNNLNATTEDWSVWQYCSKGSVPGIESGVDMNALKPGREGDIFARGYVADGTVIAAVATAFVRYKSRGRD